MTDTAARTALAAAPRTEVRRATGDVEGGWEAVGRNYSGRVVAVVWTATKNEALRLASR